MRCALVTGVQTCALPICAIGFGDATRLLFGRHVGNDGDAHVERTALSIGGDGVDPRQPEDLLNIAGKDIEIGRRVHRLPDLDHAVVVEIGVADRISGARSEEHTSELQSLMRISYAVFCLKKKKNKKTINNNT